MGFYHAPVAVNGMSVATIERLERSEILISERCYLLFVLVGTGMVCSYVVR